MRGKHLYEGVGKPDVAQAIAILNAVPIPGQKQSARLWDIHVTRHEENWFVIDVSHLLFQAKTEAEVASFLAGLIKSTDYLLQVLTREGR